MSSGSTGCASSAATMSARAHSTISVGFYGGVGPALAALPSLARRGGSARPIRICTREQAETELKAAHASGIDFFALGEPEYPSRLEMIDDPPPLVAVRGDVDALSGP